VLVNGKINSSDVTVLTGSGLNYASVDMSLLNATYVTANGKTDYKNFSLSKAQWQTSKASLCPATWMSLVIDCPQHL
jgi:hypothetical protein